MMRIASYNLRNFAEADHPTLPPRKPRELRAMAEVFHMLNADVVVVQEIASLEALNMVNARLTKPFPVVEVVQGNYHRGLHLGVLSKVSVSCKSHRTEELTDESGATLIDFADPDAASTGETSPLRFQRDLLRVDIKSDLETIAVYCVHLKSHAPAPWRMLDNDTIRKAEARALIRLIKAQSAEQPEIPVVLAGDLNETVNRTVVESIRTELKLEDMIEQDWVLEGHKPSYSYQNYPKRARLDYLFLNQNARSHYIAGSASIHGTPSGRVASDHYPVSLDLNVTGAPPRSAD